MIDPCNTVKNIFRPQEAAYFSQGFISGFFVGAVAGQKCSAVLFLSGCNH